MNNQWAHCEDPASRNQAIDACNLFSQLVNRIVA